MIASRGRDHANRRDLAPQQVGKGASRFERARVLEQLKLENERAIQAEVGAAGLMFPIAQKSVSDVLLVSDDSIAQAQQELWSKLRIAAEPGGASAFAALLSHRYVPRKGERVGVVVSGGNTTAVNFPKP